MTMTTKRVLLSLLAVAFLAMFFGAELLSTPSSTGPLTAVEKAADALDSALDEMETAAESGDLEQFGVACLAVVKAARAAGKEKSKTDELLAECFDIITS